MKLLPLTAKEFMRLEEVLIRVIAQYPTLRVFKEARVMARSCSLDISIAAAKIKNDREEVDKRRAREAEDLIRKLREN